jgi:hypothetical protein
MLNECEKEHSNGCCLFNLLIMSEQYSNQMIENKYATILLRTLNHHYNNKTLNLEDMRLELLLYFLDVINKYSSHYFFNNRLNYAKLLLRIALGALEVSRYKDNIEVMQRKIALFINISAILEKEHNYKKAEKYLRIALNCCSYHLDKAIIFNNLSKLLCCQKDYQNGITNMKYSYEYFKDDVDNVKLFNLVIL